MEVYIPGCYIFNIDLTNPILYIIESDKDAINTVTRESNKYWHWLPNKEQVNTDAQEKPGQQATRAVSTEQEQTDMLYNNIYNSDKTQSQGEQSNTDTNIEYSNKSIASDNKGETSNEPSSNLNPNTNDETSNAQGDAHVNSNANTRAIRPPPKANIHDWHKRLGHLLRT